MSFDQIPGGQLYTRIGVVPLGPLAPNDLSDIFAHLLFYYILVATQEFVTDVSAKKRPRFSAESLECGGLT